MTTVQAGNFVQVHYTGTLTDGTTFDSSQGRQPLEFQVGSGQVIPGFEQAVMGMAVKEKKVIRVNVDEAYGPHRDDLLKDFPTSMLGAQEVTKGQVLHFKSPQGPIAGRVAGVETDTFRVDFNHPLAGQDLHFSIELVGISDAPTQASCACGSPAGGGGCGH